MNIVFSDLSKHLEKPTLYASGTNSLWEDDHVSKGMLEAHLNPNWDAASRKPDFIERSVKWIKGIAPPSEFPSLLDLGCGPGLYAERFKSAGYEVTGVDFSKRSISYGMEQTLRNKSNIKYYHKDYMTIDFEEQFDVITLIYCDYAVFRRADRIALLEKVHKALKPKGKLIFDVFTPKKRKKESASWQYFENSGFFSAKSHVLLEATHQYTNDDQAELDQYVILSEEGIKSFHVWNHFFTKEILILEAKAAGFEKHEFYGDVAGKVCTEEDDVLCGVFIK